MQKYTIKRIHLIHILILFISAIVFPSCQSGSDQEVYSTHIQTPEIYRFEKDLFSIDQSKYSAELDSLQKKYPGFYELYFEQVVGFGSTQKQRYKQIVIDFINNGDLQTLYKDVDSIYGDLNSLKQELTHYFALHQQEFPEDTIPKIVSFISGFNHGIITTPGYIGIGLDLFMGTDYKFYPSLGFPQYMIRRLDNKHLMPTLAKAYATDKYELENTSPNFAEEIIYQGKLLYYIERMLPSIHDTLKIGYTGAQLEWCKMNEQNIWALFLEDNILYSGDQLKYKRYTEEAPFTIGLANESAPRIGNWCGWQIVRKYMKENPSISLKELMKETDYQKVIQGSKYRPK